jgi:hypothetical protein
MVTPTFAPMEMRAVDALPEGSEWLYEPKWENAGISRFPLKIIGNA